jgi:hypothetical protein
VTLETILGPDILCDNRIEQVAAEKNIWNSTKMEKMLMNDFLICTLYHSDQINFIGMQYAWEGCMQECSQTRMKEIWMLPDFFSLEWQ